jgi:hypothetical protein
MSKTLAYLEDMAAVDGAMDDVKEIAYHRYKGASRGVLQEIAEEADKLGVQTSMLEYWFGLATHHLLHEDLKVGNAAAWQGRVVRSFFQRRQAENGATVWDFHEDTRYTATYFRNIRQGAKRIEASSTTLALDPIAFRNVDGTTAVLAISQWETDAKIEGLPAGTYRVTFTDNESTRELARDISVEDNGGITLRVPGEGLILVTSRPASFNVMDE